MCKSNKVNTKPIKHVLLKREDFVRPKKEKQQVTLSYMCMSHKMSIVEDLAVDASSNDQVVQSHSGHV